MNTEKARDFFSSYYEGSLDAGLAQAFERQLASDAELQSEYRLFEEALNELDTLKFEEIEIPSHLHETISARIDRVAFEQKVAAKPTLTLWVRNIAFASIAAAALVGAFLSLSSGKSKVGAAGLGFNNSTEQFSFQRAPFGTMISFDSASDKTILLRKGFDGEIFQRTPLDGKKFDSMLKNSLPQPTVVSIQLADQNHQTLVALPGTAKLGVKSGQGTLEDFVRALAGCFAMPVILDVEKPGAQVTWSFSGTDASVAASSALGQSFSIETPSEGILKVSDR